jgi:amidase
MRIACFSDNGIATPGDETADVVCRAAHALADKGAIIEERRPPGIEQSYDLEMKLLGPDGGDGLRDFLQAIGSRETHRLLDGWLAKLEPYRTSVGGFARYWAELDQFRAGMCAFLREYDAILSPVSASPALDHGTSIEDEIFRGFSYTMTHNLTGWPAAVVRYGRSSTGLPIGVQVAARPWREDVALAVAGCLEQETDYVSPTTAALTGPSPTGIMVKMGALL